MPKGKIGAAAKAVAEDVAKGMEDAAAATEKLTKEGADNIEAAVKDHQLNDEAVGDKLHAAGGKRPAEVAGGNASDASSLNWNPTSRATFGHSFARHGDGPKNLRGLTGRAASTRQAQGQWLDNGAAADFLRGQYDPANMEPRIVDIPDGLGRVVNPDGSQVPATRAWLVPNPSGGYRTAYPTLDTP
jgi:hypothetical protein